MKKLGFGIVGCGVISEWHARAISGIEGIVLVGATDRNQDSREKFAGKFGIVAFDTYEQMLACRDIDVVCICTPSGLHSSMAVQAADAGKHIIVEKPMALNLEQADQIIRACDRNYVKLTVISQLRFTEAVSRMKDAVDQGLPGKLVMGNLYMKYYRSQEYYDSSSWRGTWAMDGGGALMNQGIHGIDLLQYIMGDVKSVFAYAKHWQGTSKWRIPRRLCWNLKMVLWAPYREPRRSIRDSRGCWRSTEPMEPLPCRKTALSNGRSRDRKRRKGFLPVRKAKSINRSGTPPILASKGTESRSAIWFMPSGRTESLRWMLMKAERRSRSLRLFMNRPGQESRSSFHESL